MKKLCSVYINNARIIGALYGIVPTSIWTAYILTAVPFRRVYLLRIAISFVVGGWLAARVNELGLNLWLTKHRSTEGPGTLFDGAFIGAGVGVIANFLPPLTGLIRTHHPSEAVLLIVFSWLMGIVGGAIFGTFLAVIGRAHLPHGKIGA
ncbi:MAG: hypothetical protein WCU88_10465 [Elusimicrobiota bacterium]|jgi:hypothetical protein